MRPFSSCRNTEASLIELTGIDMDRRASKGGRKAHTQAAGVQTYIHDGKISRSLGCTWARSNSI